MDREDTLSAVLSDFARVMLTDFAIQSILEHLVKRIVDVLPITSAGVTLISPGMAPRYIAASDEAALEFEKLQSGLGQGPCLVAYETGEPVFVPDLARDERFPDFGPQAVAAGMAAVFTFPLRHGEGRFGALDLYRDTAGPLGPDEQVTAQTLADVTSAYLLNAEAREEALQAAESYRERSLHDALTGLPNRILLRDRIEQASRRARRSRTSVAVMFVDLDHFKRVNDDFGHAVGDELLVAVARRLSALVRPGDTLARVSGDEFVFLCEDLAHASDVDLLASRIDEAFDAPFTLADVELAATASVGIAYAGSGEAVTESLVIDADMAMYQAKRRGGATHQVLDLRIAQESRERNELDRELRLALARTEFDLAYQPIVRTSDKAITGVEALLRWTHPDKGPIPAATAVAAAEQCGLMTKIGAWVLERACGDWVAWHAAHPDHRLDLSVNVSPRQLTAPGFVTAIATTLARTGMDPSALVLEVTESILIEDGDRAMKVLCDLKALGVRVALDDFGTGYCALSYLQRFPVDIVKIDQSFVARLESDDAASVIAASITNLAHHLDMTVTAEGVETEHQHDAVVDLGCDRTQGFFYARPVSATEFAAQLSLSDA
jgi:diguanylate cyclase (GGDEF)-like protein